MSVSEYANQGICKCHSSTAFWFPFNASAWWPALNIHCQLIKALSDVQKNCQVKSTRDTSTWSFSIERCFLCREHRIHRAVYKKKEQNTQLKTKRTSELSLISFLKEPKLPEVGKPYQIPKGETAKYSFYASFSITYMTFNDKKKTSYTYKEVSVSLWGLHIYTYIQNTHCLRTKLTVFMKLLVWAFTW